MPKYLTLIPSGLILSLSVSAALAQQVPPDPISELFPGYVPGPSVSERDNTINRYVAPDAPELLTGREISKERAEGYNAAIQQTFPMTPDMIREFRDLFEETQRATQEKPEPFARIDSGMISLEPGEAPDRIDLAPGVATVVGFYDVTGQAWPIEQFVVGSGENFQVIQLGENANNIAVTPLVNFGWSNIVIALRGEAKPVVMRMGISQQAAHYRYDVQITRPGPNALQNTAGGTNVVTEAGSSALMAVLSGVDLPSGSRSVDIEGVDARGWIIDDALFVRSRNPLMSPAWAESISGPDQVRVYKMAQTPVLLFSVNGRATRADVKLP